MCTIQGEDPTHFDNHPIAPPTFAAVIAAQAWGSLLGDEELDLVLRRTVHADQTFDLHRPLCEGDDAMARLIIERVCSHGNLDMVTILMAPTVDDEAVCDTRSILMHTREETPHD